MLALAANVITDTAKQLAATLKAEAATLTTDEAKATTIAGALDLMPALTTEDKVNVIAELPDHGVTQTVADLSLTKLGEQVVAPSKWYSPGWVKVAIGVSVLAAVGGTVYFVRRRKGA